MGCTISSGADNSDANSFVSRSTAASYKDIPVRKLYQLREVNEGSIFDGSRNSSSVLEDSKSFPLLDDIVKNAGNNSSSKPDSRSLSLTSVKSDDIINQKIQTESRKNSSLPPSRSSSSARTNRLSNDQTASLKSASSISKEIHKSSRKSSAESNHSFQSITSKSSHEIINSDILLNNSLKNQGKDNYYSDQYDQISLHSSTGTYTIQSVSSSSRKNSGISNKTRTTRDTTCDEENVLKVEALIQNENEGKETKLNVCMKEDSHQELNKCYDECKLEENEQIVLNEHERIKTTVLSNDNQFNPHEIHNIESDTIDDYIPYNRTKLVALETVDEDKNNLNIDDETEKVEADIQTPEGTLDKEKNNDSVVPKCYERNHSSISVEISISDLLSDTESVEDLPCSLAASSSGLVLPRPATSRKKKVSRSSNSSARSIISSGNDIFHKKVSYLYPSTENDLANGDLTNDIDEQQPENNIHNTLLLEAREILSHGMHVNIKDSENSETKLLDEVAKEQTESNETTFNEISKSFNDTNISNSNLIDNQSLNLEMKGEKIEYATPSDIVTNDHDEENLLQNEEFNAVITKNSEHLDGIEAIKAKIKNKNEKSILKKQNSRAQVKVIRFDLPDSENNCYNSYDIHNLQSNDSFAKTFDSATNQNISDETLLNNKRNILKEENANQRENEIMSYLQSGTIDDIHKENIVSENIMPILYYESNDSFPTKNNSEEVRENDLIPDIENDGYKDLQQEESIYSYINFNLDTSSTKEDITKVDKIEPKYNLYSKSIINDTPQAINSSNNSASFTILHESAHNKGVQENGDFTNTNIIENGNYNVGEAIAIEHFNDKIISKNNTIQNDVSFSSNEITPENIQGEPNVSPNAKLSSQKTEEMKGEKSCSEFSNEAEKIYNQWHAEEVRSLNEKNNDSKTISNQIVNVTETISKDIALESDIILKDTVHVTEFIPNDEIGNSKDNVVDVDIILNKIDNIVEQTSDKDITFDQKTNLNEMNCKFGTIHKDTYDRVNTEIHQEIAVIAQEELFPKEISEETQNTPKTESNEVETFFDDLNANVENPLTKVTDAIEVLHENVSNNNQINFEKTNQLDMNPKVMNKEAEIIPKDPVNATKANQENSSEEMIKKESETLRDKYSNEINDIKEVIPKEPLVKNISAPQGELEDQVHRINKDLENSISKTSKENRELISVGTTDINISPKQTFYSETLPKENNSEENSRSLEENSYDGGSSDSNDNATPSELNLRENANDDLLYDNKNYPIIVPLDEHTDYIVSNSTPKIDFGDVSDDEMLSDTDERVEATIVPEKTDFDYLIGDNIEPTTFITDKETADDLPIPEGVNLNEMIIEQSEPLEIIKEDPIGEVYEELKMHYIYDDDNLNTGNELLNEVNFKNIDSTKETDIAKREEYENERNKEKSDKESMPFKVPGLELKRVGKLVASATGSKSDLENDSSERRTNSANVLLSF